ncbi:DUF4190 domain-containing protein [Kitasatospora sp. NPDC002551]|uniref:DUF4190 domain-containing protein n=1 Tax=Kitasatospora sp. NPDC002551 TaxID=3154539 RepID=UPI003330119A
MSKPESDAAAPVSAPEPEPAPEPVSQPVESVEPAGATEPAGRVELTKPPVEPTPGAAPEPAAVPAPAEPATGAVPGVAAPGPAPEAAQGPWAPPAPAGPPVADPWATPAGPPAAHPWATPAAAMPPPFDPDRPRATGWAAVVPGAQSGFQPGFAYPQAPTATNGFAVAALVTGLLCMWPLALAFAIVAMVQIPKRNEKGRGMAVTGLVTGVLGAIVSLFGVIGLLAVGVEAEEYGDTPRGPKGSVQIEELRAGDCFNEPPLSSGQSGESASIYWVLVVSCSAPHNGEVAGSGNLAGRGPAAYPSTSEIDEMAERICGPVRDDYALDSWLVPDGMEEGYYYPSRVSWASGDREVTCTFQDNTRTHTGSVHTDRTKLTRAQRTYLDAVLAYNNALAVQPEGEADEEPTEYRTWAKTMATASRKEVTDLSATGIDWPEGARAKLIELGAIKLDAANAWDAAAKSADVETLDREVGKALALSVKSSKLAVDIRRELGLSTGEQASEIRV